MEETGGMEKIDILVMYCRGIVCIYQKAFFVWALRKKCAIHDRLAEKKQHYIYVYTSYLLESVCTLHRVTVYNVVTQICISILTYISILSLS